VNLQADRVLRARDRTLDLGNRTYIMAIVNLTADSFSGDGVGDDIDEAVRLAVAAQEDGADIVDVGAESARADAPSRDANEEADAVARCVTRIAAETDVIVSVDTYKGGVAEAGLQAGGHIVNDIGGFQVDTQTADAAARHHAALVINYTIERPKVRPAAPPMYDDLVGQHLAYLADRVGVARSAGVASDSLIIDPGIAFGKSHDEDLEILRRLGEFRSLQLPILIAASRKHFIGSATGLSTEERDDATLAVTALAIAGGADIVRVHDVRRNARAARMADAIVRGRAGDFAPADDSWPWAATASPVAGTRIGELGKSTD
jgi:dihydropteroate synthase